jgi:hypothetical protein
MTSAIVAPGRFGAVVRQFTPTLRVSAQLPVTNGREQQGAEMKTVALLMLTFNVIAGHGTGPSGCIDETDQETTEPRIVRVRSHSPELGDVIRLASDASVTFERLIATIDRTNGLIYVDEGKCGHGVSACLLLSVQVAGPFRVLRIKVDARRRKCDLMAQIGHELQHAIEILSDAHVTDGVGAYSLMERIAPGGPISDRGRFETAAAVRAGLDIRREACTAAH